MTDTAADERALTPEVLERLRFLDAHRTPGVWKIWGMTVMADQDGSNNVGNAVLVARTALANEFGSPRTFDADLIATVVRFLPQLLDAAEDATVPADEAQPPECERHLETQHRDKRPPWCNECGWRHAVPARPARPAVKLGRPISERPPRGIA